MLRQILVGGAVSVCNIAVHAAAMMLVVGAARAANARYADKPRVRLAGVMIATVVMLMIAHVLEVAVWALTYEIFEVGPAGNSFFYFAFVNFTTLGYGDIVPVPSWQILGPMTAMNGVLLFGWSTAVIFDVLRRTMTQ
jgi:hypothetical protein